MGIDDEGRPILERVDLMEAFFTVKSKNHVCRKVRVSEAERERLRFPAGCIFRKSASVKEV